MTKVKKNGKQSNIYFGEREEQAMIDYQRSTDQNERNRIFSKILYPALQKMVECIINRWKLYPTDRDYEEIKNDALSDIIEKIDKFDSTKNCRAYSYFGTICKHYLIGEQAKSSKSIIKSTSYEDTHKNNDEDGFGYGLGGQNEELLEYDEELILGSIDAYMNNEQAVLDEERKPAKTTRVSMISSSDIGISQKIENENLDTFDIYDNFAADVIDEVVRKMKDMVKNREEYKLSDKEVLVGESLIQLFENWEELFNQLGTKKFTKSSIFYYLREMTFLKTSEIKTCLRKYKRAYGDLKRKMLN